MPLAVLERENLNTAEHTGEKPGRVYALDFLRGCAMIFVMVYHLLYDFDMYGVGIPEALTPGATLLEIIHTFFLWILFCVSGICASYSRNLLKRGVTVYIIGWIITAVTSVIFPSELIVFGVLSCFDACMIITSFLKKALERIPWGVLFAASIVLWLVFWDFHKSGEIHLGFWDIQLADRINSDYLYPLGVKGESFTSSDYFPVIPFIFMYWTGFALYTPISQNKLPKFFYKIRSKAIGFIGKHSLAFYIVHQPLMLLIFELAL